MTLNSLLVPLNLPLCPRINSHGYFPPQETPWNRPLYNKYSLRLQSTYITNQNYCIILDFPKLTNITIYLRFYHDSCSIVLNMISYATEFFHFIYYFLSNFPMGWTNSLLSAHPTNLFLFIHIAVFKQASIWIIHR